jgi:hypothetical protein
MRSSTAITLVLFGGGVVATAVALPHRCDDPVTGQPAACPPGFHATAGASRGFSGFVSSIGDVARGGFGHAGAAMVAGS